MIVTRSQQGQVTILSVQGPMVEEELRALETEVDRCINAGLLRIVLELRQAPFVDSAGLEKIQSMVSDFGRRGGDVRVCALNDICRDIFLCTRMESFVQVFDDRESAVRSLL
ncbi:MAG: STAS domain-containing protein [Candidatus Hydrogenedentes bacterium]|nr:STAS domain-containing protein [Candidatus Hydrogenedentota bacterium]